MATEFSKYRRAAIEAKPSDAYEVKAWDIVPSDLVYCWTSSEFLRADSPLWKHSPLVYREDIIYIARRVSIGAFERSVLTKRIYKVRG